MKNQRSYLLYPTEIQKKIIEDSFQSYMDIYNGLIQYSRNVGKDNAVKYANKARLYKVMNDMKKDNRNLSVLDNSTLSILIDTYKSDIEHVIKSNRRFPLKKVSTSQYIIDNSINKNGIDYFNTNYIKLPKLGYVKMQSNDNLPVESVINKAIVKKDNADNYRVVIEYDDEKRDEDRVNRIQDFLYYYDYGYFPNGEKIIDKDYKIPRKIRILGMQTHTVARFNMDKPMKKEIVKINYVHRDYVKKVDEYDHAKKLYEKYPEKFPRGVIFGHTIIIPGEDGVDFTVIYDKNPLSSYRKWNVKLLPKEKELIMRNCQSGIMKYFPEYYLDDENTINIDNIVEENNKEEIIDNDQEYYEYDFNQDDIIVKDSEDILSEEEQMTQLLLDSNISNQRPNIQQNNYYNPQYQYSGNNNWTFTNSYYNSQY